MDDSNPSIALSCLRENICVSWIEEYEVIASLGVAVTGGLLILLNHRRLILVALAFQYIFVAWLAGLALPLQVATVKLVSGFMACSIIAVTLANVELSQETLQPRTIPTGRLFRFVAFMLVLIASLGLGRSNWISLPNLSPVALYGLTILMTIGLLQVGLHEEPVRVGAGLLTLMSGFEVAYSGIEPSYAVIAMLAAVHLGIAFVVSYILTLVMMTSPPGEVTE